MISLKFASQVKEHKNSKNISRITGVILNYSYRNFKIENVLGLAYNGGNRVKGQIDALTNAIKPLPRIHRKRIWNKYFTTQSKKTKQIYNAPTL